METALSKNAQRSCPSLRGRWHSLLDWSVGPKDTLLLLGAGHTPEPPKEQAEGQLQPNLSVYLSPSPAHPASRTLRTTPVRGERVTFSRVLLGGIS
jgi:hypothetical protein